MIGSVDIEMTDSRRHTASAIGVGVLLASVLTFASQPAVGVASGSVITLLAASVYGFDYLRAGSTFLCSFGLLSHAFASVSPIGTMALILTGAAGVLLSFVFAAIAAIFATNTIAWFVYQLLTFKGKVLTMIKGFLVAPVAFLAAVTNNELPLVGDVGEYVFAIFVVALAFSFHGLNQGREVFQFRRTAQETAGDAAARARTGGLGSFLSGSLFGAASRSATGEEFGSEQTFGSRDRSETQHAAGGSKRAAPDTAGSSPAGSADATTPRGAGSETGTEESKERPASRHGRSETERCRSCGDQIDPDSSFCPSCGVESPFDRTAVEADSETATEQSSEAVSGVRNTVASTVERRFDPSSREARQLCRVLSDRSASESEIETALEETVERLESVTALTETIESIDPDASPSEYERTAERLERTAGDLPEAVGSVLLRLQKRTDERQQRVTDRETLRSDVETICDLAERSDAVPSRNGDLERRTTALATALRDGSVTISDPGSPIESAATEVERSVRPSSRPSERLLEELGTLDDRTAVRSALEAGIEVLEEHAETREMLSDIGVDDVRRRLDSLDRELGGRDTSVYSHLSDRVRELEALLEDPEAVDDIQLYAIYQEISFYDRTLLPRLSRSRAETSHSETTRTVADVRRRIERIDSEYVSVRPDHNHSIPNHFLGLAETLSEDAEALTETAPMRADGLLCVADAVLDHVEALYERNEYSVMLRRLQG